VKTKVFLILWWCVLHTEQWSNNRS